MQTAEATMKEKIASLCKITGEDIWYGFHRIIFEFQSRTAWIVEPSAPPLGDRPWTWTMQWAEAFVDRTGALDLLAKGWYHTTIDLYSTRMNEEGLRIAAAYQCFLVETLGFAPKARLIGMSWGGFFSTRYAANYPENVARVYLDAPLLTFDIYADGLADNPQALAEKIGPWAGRRPATSWADSPEMPVNLAAKIAEARIPLLLLYGGQDQTVVPAANSETFIPRFKEAGGDIQVEFRHLFGHHPHGVDPDKTQIITDFLSAK